jgi:hypothetical protein
VALVNLTLAPVGEAMTTLLALAEAEDNARERIDHVDTEQRQAAIELAEAREALEALVQLEAGTPTAQERKQAEMRLTRAEQKAAERWPERRQGAERAARDARHTLQRYAAEHEAELVAEAEERGRDAAGQVDHTGEAFMAACGRRDQAERDLTAIVALIRPMSPGDISRARSDEARQAVQRFLAQGGEDAPTLRVPVAESVPAA